VKRLTRTKIVVGSIVLAGALVLGASAATDYGSLLKQARTEFPAKYAGPTKPAKAPKGIKIAFVTCASALHGCVSPAIGGTHAAKALGWKAVTYDGGGTAQKQNAQMLNAISAGAKVIVNLAIDPNLVQQGLRAAKKAGVLVVSGSNGLSQPNPTPKLAKGKLGYAFDMAPDYYKLGYKAAQWMIGDSKGKANVLVMSDKEFPSVMAVQRGLLAGLKTCKTCTVSKPQYFTGAQVGNPLIQQTLGYLRSHQGVDYVFSPFDPAAAVQAPALAQNGFAQVKLMGVLGDQQNLDFIRNSAVQVADAAYDNEYMGWSIVDQTIRLLNHQPLSRPIGENEPFVVLDKS
jgi:ribose transport system substrate-binding protein